MSLSFTTSLTTSSTAALRPNPGAANVAGTIVTIGGFLLLAAAVASGAPEGIWSSALIVGAGVPLRHSLEPVEVGPDAVGLDGETGRQTDEQPGERTGTASVVRRHPLLLALALAMTTAGALLGILLSN